MHSRTNLAACTALIFAILVTPAVAKPTVSPKFALYLAGYFGQQATPVSSPPVKVGIYPNLAKCNGAATTALKNILGNRLLFDPAFICIPVSGQSSAR